MDWASKYHVEDQRTYQRPSGNEVISELIYELTGQVRIRKEVASHVQVLKGWAQGGYIADERKLHNTSI